MTSLRPRPLLLVAILLAAGAARAPASGQAVRGTVTDESGVPLQGAFVRLLDASGVPVAGTLSRPAGDYALAAPAAGTYTLRAELIGRETVEHGPVELAVGRLLSWSPALPPLPVDIRGLEVSADRRCEVTPTDGTALATLWEEAQKALEVASWAADEELFRYRTVGIQREVDPERERVERERRVPRSGFYRQPFVSRPPADLLANGFVQEADDGTWVFAPDAGVMLHDDFTRSHCLSLVREEGGVGIAFEPVRERQVPDIRGVMWLDPVTAELLAIDYRYTRFPGARNELGLGGRVEFERLVSGAWIVRRWRLDTPIRADVERAGSPGAWDRRTVGILEQGGEVLEVVDADRATVFRADRATLAGTVFDSIRGGPLVGAEVRMAGTEWTTRTGPGGGWMLSDLPEGPYAVRVGHPFLDSLGVQVPEVVAELEAGRTTRVHLAVPAEVPVAEDDIAVLEGEILTADGTAPRGGVLASLLDASQSAQAMALTSPLGRYRFSVAAGGTYRVGVEAPGHAPWVSEPFPLSLGRVRRHSVRPSLEPVVLPGPPGGAPGACVAAPDPGSPAGRAWYEVRKSLTALSLAAGSSPVGYEVRLWEADDPERAGGAPARVTPVDGPVRHGFPPLPRDLRGRRIFVATTDTALFAPIPGPALLSDPDFDERYCLRHVPSPAGDGTVALRFEPTGAPAATADRAGRGDIHGLLVLDAGSGALRAFHYRYAAFPGPLTELAPGGWIRFARLPGGEPFLRAWERRLPGATCFRDMFGHPSTARTDPTGDVVWDGGEAVAALGPDDRTVWQAPESYLDAGVRVAMWATGASLDPGRREAPASGDPCRPRQRAADGLPDPDAPPSAEDAVTLEPVTVEVQGRLPRLTDVGFYERRERGFSGTHITREDIEERATVTRLGDLLRNLPGVALVRYQDVPGAEIVRMTRRGLSFSDRASLRGCEPHVYLDGARQYDRLTEAPYLQDINRIVDPRDIAGVEVYTGLTGPGRFESDGCGMILVWTRDGR